MTAWGPARPKWPSGRRPGTGGQRYAGQAVVGFARAEVLPDGVAAAPDQGAHLAFEAIGLGVDLREAVALLQAMAHLRFQVAVAGGQRQAEGSAQAGDAHEDVEGCQDAGHTGQPSPN